jgi:hypothetical protein
MVLTAPRRLKDYFFCILTACNMGRDDAKSKPLFQPERTYTSD